MRKSLAIEETFQQKIRAQEQALTNANNYTAINIQDQLMETKRD